MSEAITLLAIGLQVFHTSTQLRLSTGSHASPTNVPLISPDLEELAVPADHFMHWGERVRRADGRRFQLHFAPQVGRVVLPGLGTDAQIRRRLPCCSGRRKPQELAIAELLQVPLD